MRRRSPCDALSQGDHRQAIAYFRRATNAAAYDAAGYLRAAAIYYARAAEAHLGPGEIEDVCAAASSAVGCLGRLESSRENSTLADLRTHLGSFSSIPIVREVLDGIARRTRFCRPGARVTSVGVVVIDRRGGAAQDEVSAVGPGKSPATYPTGGRR